jgi:hypothetical protein
MKIVKNKKKNKYQPGAIRGRYGIAIFPKVIMGHRIWLHYYFITEELTKLESKNDTYYWRPISLMY